MNEETGVHRLLHDGMLSQSQKAAQLEEDRTQHIPAITHVRIGNQDSQRFREPWDAENATPHD